MDKSIKKIFSDIEKTRSKNNKNWMDLLGYLLKVTQKNIGNCIRNFEKR